MLAKSMAPWCNGLMLSNVIVMFMFILTKVWIMYCKIYTQQKSCNWHFQFVPETKRYPTKLSSPKSSKAMNACSHSRADKYFTQVLVAQTLQCFLCSCWLFAKVFRPPRCGLQPTELVAESSYNMNPAGSIKCVKFLTYTKVHTICTLLPL